MTRLGRGVAATSAAHFELNESRRTPSAQVCSVDHEICGESGRRDGDGGEEAEMGGFWSAGGTCTLLLCRFFSLSGKWDLREPYP